MSERLKLRHISKLTSTESPYIHAKNSSYSSRPRERERDESVCAGGVSCVERDFVYYVSMDNPTTFGLMLHRIALLLFVVVVVNL